MKTAIEKIGSGYLLVNADGTPVSHSDAENYKLHVVPKLNIPLERSRTKLDMKLASASLILDEQSINILPNDVQIRQPYPNCEYYVAGTSDRKIGWEIDAPDTESLQVEFKWEVFGNSEYLPCKVFHKINIRLSKSKEGHVFSFDESDFALSPVPRILGFICPEDETQFFHKGNPSHIQKSDCDLIGYKIEITQDVTLTSKAYSDHMSSTFEEMELLRDQPHAVQFSNFVEEFNDIISFQLPAFVLLEAIATARDYPCKNIQDKNYCDHPAFDVARSYIKHNNPNGRLKDFSYLELFVRVSDDDDLWAADTEHPNMAITDFKSKNWCLAGCEGVVLCIFNQEWDNNKMPFEWADYAALEALQNFPGNFPNAYRFLRSHF